MIIFFDSFRNLFKMVCMSLMLLMMQKYGLFKYVSRETGEKLELYEVLLRKWSGAYNLVQKDTLPHLVQRHFIDSLQLVPLIRQEQSLLDVGTGAGFPGMILAISGGKDITLVEKNKKKCLFLEEVARQTSTPVKILNQKWENVEGTYQQVTARAFANLSTLLGLLKVVSRETNPVGYFLKGSHWQQELADAKKVWNFTHEIFPSLTAEGSQIIKVTGIQKK